MSHRTVSAIVAELGARPGVVQMKFLTPEGVVAVELAVSGPESHALAHIHALMSHSPGCRASPDVYVGLLLRTIGVLDGRPECVVVRGRCRPTFLLRLRRDAQVWEVDLGILDAVCLLACQRVPVEVEMSSTWELAAD
ncbi:MAG: hypothetical protein ACRDZO_06525 [Egibacteraceae bacterium]